MGRDRIRTLQSQYIPPGCFKGEGNEERKIKESCSRSWYFLRNSDHRAGKRRNGAYGIEVELRTSGFSIIFDISFCTAKSNLPRLREASLASWILTLMKGKKKSLSRFPISYLFKAYAF